MIKYIHCIRNESHNEFHNPVFIPINSCIYDLIVPGGSEDKASAYNVGDPGSIPGRKISWRRKWLPTPVFLPGKSHGQRTLVGCSPWGHKELDTTERLHFLSLISLDFVHLILYFPEDTHISILNISKQLFEESTRKKLQSF